MSTSIESEMRDRLCAHLAIQQLIITNESHLHRGHGTMTGEGETHFRVEIISNDFNGKTRLERQKWIYSLLKPLWGRGLHALSIDAKTGISA